MWGGGQGDDYAVVEISSFQLQWVETFRPRVAVLLNTTCDHVDYHGSFFAYRETKERIFACQTQEDFAVLNGDEETTETLRRRLSAKILCFSSTARPGGACIFREGNELIYEPGDEVREAYPIKMIKIPGRHNLENVMAALVVARICGCTPEGIVAAVENFKGMPHRIEYVGIKQGVSFYDDSKGTNVDAVRRALETFPAPTILLMGGRDKEGDFASLAPSIRDHVKLLILFGEARARIHDLAGGIVPTQCVATLGQAIQTAYGEARSGDIVLLSPGCASFDEFRDYKDRGRFFRKMVEELADV